jgi:hypothetical protein
MKIFMIRMLVATILTAGAMWAQLAASSIVGTVTDPSGLGVPGATIKAVHVDTGQVRQTTPDSHGDFVLSSLEPGAYTLTVTLTGFKTKELQDLVLVTGETRPLGKVQLELGDVSDKVQVIARSESVMTRSSERAAEITSSEIEDLEVRGRNFMGLMELLPGVVSTAVAQDLSTNPSIYVAGNRNTSNNVTIDGTPSNDMGNGNQMKLTVSQDAVAEVKVLTSNYQAEYGRLSGSNVIVATKSGARAFHGLASYFTRNEDFNANNFFNNLNGLPRPRYRYNTITYNISGPITIPHHFNSSRDKLFFFWGQEWWPSTLSTQGTVTVPNALERQGNFSQSLSQAGTLTVVRDPLNGNAQFPNNIVPTSRLDPNGVALLSVFPQPNFTNRAISGGNYNYVFSTPYNKGLSTNSGKADYILNSSNTITFSLNMYGDDETGALGVTTAAGNWPMMVKTYHTHGNGTTEKWTRIITPTLINELSFGVFAQPASNTYSDAELQKIVRSTVGFNAPQFSAATNDINVLPNATFGGVPNAANIAIEGRLPLYNRYYILHLADNVTYVRGSHTIKAGIYLERFTRNQKKSGTVFNGAFDFQNNATNPFNTSYAYSNAAIGSFNTYTQSTSRNWMNIRDWDAEGFIQDNWKATRRLTVDIGMRLYWIPPMTERDNLIAGFVFGQYNPAQAVKLIQPAMNGSTRVGIDPTTGQIYSATLIGAIAPGFGNPANGMVTASNPGSLPNSLVQDRGIQWAPRVGFAYDVFGDGKTALRGGFGIFYNRPTTEGYFGNFVGQPPLSGNPTVTYGQISTLGSSTGLLAPSAAYAPDLPGKSSTVMNYSLSVQRDIGFQTVIDAGYVGTLGRHLQWEVDQNGIPIGADFRPSNIDPTTGKVLTNNFLRPIIGYGAIYAQSFGASSNYNSLQVSARRRFAKHFQFGGAWTWSKAMDYADTDTTQVESMVNPRAYYYGKAVYDRTHNVSLNYIYDLPNSRSRNAVVKGFLDHWELSGITIFQSGAPLGVTMTTTNGQDITGTASLAPRPNVIANPVLPKSERTFGMNFNTAALQLPAVGTLGNAAPDIFRGPGINNWDMSIIKNITLYERLHIQLRVATFNTFNHTQFTTVNTAATFNPATGAQTNSKLGAFTAARDPRQMQLGIRLVY